MKIKRIVYKVVNIINPMPAPKYGNAIFKHRTWLEREVDNALYKQARDHAFGIR